jgi:hypothetical protein
VLEFVKVESGKAKLDERLLGSSEIIESLFGKQKQFEKQQSKSGFTGSLLTMASFVANTTVDIVCEAMETVKTKMVTQWQKINIGQSLQSQRTEAFKFAETKE